MSGDCRRALLRLTVLTCAAIAMLLAVAGASQADPFGELAHFADKGELTNPEAAIGVDPLDNSVFVVDEINEGSTFRIQKFEQVSGTYKPVASATFKPKSPGEEPSEIEGVAVDPTKGVVYALANEERPQGKSNDGGDEAAGQIFGFKIAQSGSTLEFAEGSSEGIVVNTETLHPLSNTFGASLLYPGGITVNPKNHNVIITGYVDRGKIQPVEENTAAAQEVEIGATPATSKLGPRWVDEKNEVFEECACLNSPVVTPAGQIYVLAESDQVWELPSTLNPATKPKKVFQLPGLEFCNEARGTSEECTWTEELTFFPGESGEEGAQMSLGPEGKFYLRNRIALASEGNFDNGGVMILSPEFKELGWVGGGSSASETNKCAVNELTFQKPKVAVGKEEDVFMLSRPAAAAAKILELGPGGSNCPKGTATTPTAKSEGQELERFPMAKKVAFSSTVTQANAVSTEWEFGDGTSETVSTRQQAKTSVEHKFVKQGKLTVTEKIHTDNLATPLITKTRPITIVGPPKVEHEAAKPSGSSVTLKAEVNPELQETTCEFEYGTVAEPFPTSHKAACPEAPGEGEEPVPESVEVKGLTEGVEYHFRLAAKNASGNSENTEGTKFLMPSSGGPTAVTTEASEVGSKTATLKGTVNPNGSESSCKFEYGTSISYGKEAACSPATVTGSSPVAVKAAIAGLTANTTYHFRVVAENTGKTKGSGVDKEFKTAEEGAKPTATTEAASEVGQRSAKLNGKVDPNGESTTCEFEYGTVLPSGKLAPCASSPGGGKTEVAVSAVVKELEPGKAYKFKLLAKNGQGTGEGTPKELTTHAVEAPSAQTTAASAVTQTTATLNGMVNPRGEATTCKFEYGTVLPSGKVASCTTAPGSGTGEVAVSAPVSGLAAGTVYRFKVLAENATKETAAGAEQPFTTASVPPPPPPPPPTTIITGNPVKEVLPIQEVKAVPIVTVAGTSITVTGAGAFPLKLSCPKEETSCAGTVTVKTLSAVAARAAQAAAKKKILTLSTGAFTMAGSQLKTITLHISSKGKAALAKLHTLRAKATIVAHDTHGATHTSTAVITLKLKKKK